MYLGTVYVKSCFERSAYESKEWDLIVHWDGDDVYTEDALGDYDVIGYAETLEEAMDFVNDYFHFPHYDF